MCENSSRCVMYVITFHLLRKKKHHHEETYPHPQFIDDANETQGGETGYHLYMPYKGGSESSPNAYTVRARFAMKPAWVVIFFVAMRTPLLKPGLDSLRNAFKTRCVTCGVSFSFPSSHTKISKDIFWVFFFPPVDLSLGNVLNL